jgi:hypothetical protein
MYSRDEEKKIVRIFTKEEVQTVPKLRTRNFTNQSQKIHFIFSWKGKRPGEHWFSKWISLVQVKTSININQSN